MSDDSEAEAARRAEQQLDEFTAKLDDEEARRLKAAAQAEQRRARREAKADAAFRAELEAEARQEAPARLTETEQMEQIAAAIDLLEQADGELLRRVREIRAVANAPLTDQRVTRPSLGGLLPSQMEQIEREEAARARGWENEQRARAAWVEDQEETINRLCAGQTPDNQRQIRAQFNAQKARG